MSVSTYLRTLRSFDMAFEAPADQAALTSMEEAIGYPLLDDLRTLYQDHGGMSESNRVPAMRLLSPPGVVKITGMIRKSFPGLLDECAGLFWTDDNSNYAGVWLAPPLLGRVFCLKRDEVTDMPPKFRSVESFCQSMLTAWDQHSPTTPGCLTPHRGRRRPCHCDRVSAGNGDASLGRPRIFDLCVSRPKSSSAEGLGACAALG